MLLLHFNFVVYFCRWCGCVCAVCRSVVFFCSWQCMKTPLFGVYKPQKVEFQLYFCCVFFWNTFLSSKKNIKNIRYFEWRYFTCMFFKKHSPTQKALEKEHASACFIKWSKACSFYVLFLNI